MIYYALGLLVSAILAVLMHLWAQAIFKEHALKWPDDVFAMVSYYFLGVLPCILSAVGCTIEIVRLLYTEVTPSL